MRVHEHPYQVEGEVGRFTFTTHAVGKGERRSHPTARWLFPPLQAKEWYRTRGFKELALVHGVVEESYRKTCALLNRLRHQEGATPVRTLCDTSEGEGQQILAQMEREADRILARHGFTPEGLPPEEWAPGTAAPVLSPPAVQEALAQCELPEVVKAEMAHNPVPYEMPSCHVYISPDAVGVKAQKAQRGSAAPQEQEGTPPSQKEYVYTTVAHVAHDDGTYVLAGTGIVPVVRWLVALLLHNGLWDHGLIFLTDGQKTLQAAILQRLAWWGPVQLILDWYHLDKRCKEMLSLAVIGREVRNTVLKELRYWLWHGLTDRAIRFLQQVEGEKIKQEKARDELIGYLERCTPYIPCYAVRQHLGLRNSSNIGEKMNDLVVAERQKHNGMSWSAEGSVALAALTALIRNQNPRTWFEKSKIEFKLIA